jgi:hypothetical protein
MVTIAEKKLKEFMLTIVEQKHKYTRVELFARLIGISTILYTSDDMRLFYRMNKALILGYERDLLIILVKDSPHLQG